MEILDIYDSQGNPTGKTIKRGESLDALKENEHIAVGVIFIENDKGEFLIQKTSKEKGGKFSSTGGHIDSGETPLKSIQREVLEELGLNISKDEIQECGYLLYDKPIRFLFYLKKNIKLEDIKVQQEEVEYVVYKTKKEIEELIKNKEMLESHGILFKELMKKKEKRD